MTRYQDLVDALEEQQREWVEYRNFCVKFAKGLLGQVKSYFDIPEGQLVRLVPFDAPVSDARNPQRFYKTDEWLETRGDSFFYSAILFSFSWENVTRYELLQFRYKSVSGRVDFEWYSPIRQKWTLEGKDLDSSDTFAFIMEPVFAYLLDQMRNGLHRALQDSGRLPIGFVSGQQQLD